MTAKKKATSLYIEVDGVQYPVKSVTAQEIHRITKELSIGKFKVKQAGEFVRPSKLKKNTPAIIVRVDKGA